MTTTMNLETPVNGANLNEVSEIINGIDNGICTVSCVTSTTSVDAAGDYRITRRLECVWANKDVAASDRILDLEISGTQGTAPVVTLNGQVLPTASLILAANGVLEWISGWAEDGMEGVSIAADQWRYLVEDGFASVSALSRADSIDAYTAIPGDHARRRLGHVREGVDRSFVLAERGWLRSLEPLRSVWRPFFKMVRDDFS